MIYGPLSEVLLDGRYRVGEVIGSGGFGTVYAAMHLGLEAKVAIKVPRIDDLNPRSIPAAVAEFLEEGRTLKRLRHPNLVAALDVALLPPDDHGLALPYLVLEWCDGPTLKEWRASRPGPMDARAVWELLRPAFEGLAHAHDEGVAHRDIKPANILLETSRDGALVPRVIDFGIAKIVGAGEHSPSGATRTTSERRVYTPKYAAPEQLAGLRTTTRTDVFALALVFLETVRGAPIFSTDDDAKRAIVESDLPTPRKLGLDLGAWNAPFERALAARPADRWSDAGAFLRALDASRPTGSIGPPHSPPPAPTGGGAARDRPVRAAALLAPPIADDSVVPSSHTLRTASQSREPSATSHPWSQMALVLGGFATLLLAGFVLLILFPAGGLDALKRMQVRPASASAASPRSAPAVSATSSASSPTAEPSSPAPNSAPTTSSPTASASAGATTAPPVVVIPSRLAGWTGPELAERVREMGGEVQGETVVLDVTTLMYRLDGKDGFAALGVGDPRSFLASSSGPFAYAVDQNVAVVIKGDADLGKIPHLKRLLGTAAATRLAEHH